MANNEYINKVEYGDQTLMDITDTTATENDVLEGEVFYSASGARGVGTLGDATTSTHGLMSVEDKVKLNNINLLGVKLNTTTLTPDANGYVSIPLMTGATSSADGTAGLIPAPTSADREKFFRGDGTWQDGGKPMVILSYGTSTWNDFINAYNNNVIVYCRASSNSNPATGSQTRMAFMAYVNDASSPTNVEFQYYRSMNAHSATAMGDEVYIYKLTNANGGTWSVTTRKAGIKEIDVASGSKLGVSWNSDKVTLSNTMTADDMPMSSSDATTTKSAIDTLNSKVASSTDYVLSTFDDVKSKLLELAGNMVAGESKLVRLVYTGTQVLPMFHNYRYMGYLKKSYSGNFFTWDGTAYSGDDIHFAYDNSTWRVYSLNSNLAQIGKVCEVSDTSSRKNYSFTIPSNFYLSSGYKFAILIYGIDGNSFTVIGLFLQDDGSSIKNYTIFTTGNVRSLTFSRNSNVINITANDMVWGGFRLLFLG